MTQRERDRGPEPEPSPDRPLDRPGRRRKPAATAGGILAAALLIATLESTAADGTAAPPSKVPVHTSRGEFSLILYAPAVKDPSTGTPPSGGLSGSSPRPGSGAARTGSGAMVRRPHVLLISGEGGWRQFDDRLCGWLRDAGYWVGGLDAMKYFWSPQDDRQALASDVRAFAGALAQASGEEASAPLILAGFSFGADLAPWIAGAGGWGPDLRGLVMIGPDEIGSLEFRFSEILGFAAKDHVFPVAEALRSASGVPVLFIHGEKDSGSAAPDLVKAASEPRKLVVIPGADHHFSGTEADLERALIEGLGWIESVASPPSSAPPARPSPGG